MYIYIYIYMLALNPGAGAGTCSLLGCLFLAARGGLGILLGYPPCCRRGI